MTALLSNLGRDESGATAIEYGLIAGLISIVVLGWATFTGSTLTSVFENIAQSLSLA
jgi:pilus assembly protein Flp/PilA